MDRLTHRLVHKQPKCLRALCWQRHKNGRRSDGQILTAKKYANSYILPPLKRFSSSSSSSRYCAPAMLADVVAAAGCAGADSDNKLNAESTLFGRNELQSLIILCWPSTPIRLSSASNKACDASRICGDNANILNHLFYFTCDDNVTKSETF